MAYSNDQIFVNAYNAMKHHLSSQQGSKLKGLFEERPANGEKVFFDRVGTLNVNAIVSPGAPLTHQDASWSRRMCTVAAFEAAPLIYELDTFKMLVDPTNDVVKEIVGAHNRNYDDVVFAAMLGTAATGKEGAGSAAFDTSNQQIAHGSTSLTLAKLLQAQKILKKADVDFDNEDIYLFFGPEAEEDLLAITNFTSADFQNSKILGSKELPSFRGMKLVFSNRIPEHTAGSVYRVLVASSRAMKIARYMEPVVRFDQRIDLSDQPTQIYSKSSVGAVRMEEKLVVDVLFQ